MQMLHKTGKIDVAYGETQAHPSMNKGADAGKKVYEKSLAAFQKYVLQPMHVQVDLFKAKEQMFFLHDPEFYGWNHFAEKGVAVHELDGNHLNMFDKINGVKLAKRLQRVLDERNQI